MAHEIIIDNVATLKVYNSDPVTPANSNYVTFDKIITPSHEKAMSFITQIERCTEILKDCITDSQQQKTIKIYLGWNYDDGNTFSENDTTLGWANGNTIAINQWNTIGDYYLNDTPVHQNISVIIHEIFHIFGLFPNPNSIDDDDDFGEIEDSEGTTRRIYTGANGLNGYKKVLLANNITVPDPIYICLEDDFGPGTVNVHLEEGYHDETSNNPLGNEVIEINGQ